MVDILNDTMRSRQSITGGLKFQGGPRLSEQYIRMSVFHSVHSLTVIFNTRSIADTG